jgi:hypothetical protein
MPAYTFEKLSPSPPRDPVAPRPEKRRGMIVQMFGRLMDLRPRRSFRREKVSTSHRQEPRG